MRHVLVNRLVVVTTLVFFVACLVFAAVQA
jgi:hypothetical protein